MIEVPMSRCCGCGYEMDRATNTGLTGRGTEEGPVAGDASLCLMCGALSIFNEDMSLREPTDDEIFLAAADSNIQKARRAILELKGEREKACSG